MTTLYESTPDARQQGEIEVSRFRPHYRTLSEDELNYRDKLKYAACTLETLIDELPDSRYKSLALTDLESSIMWAVKQLTS